MKLDNQAMMWCDLLSSPRSHYRQCSVATLSNQNKASIETIQLYRNIIWPDQIWHFSFFFYILEKEKIIENDEEYNNNTAYRIQIVLMSMMSEICSCAIVIKSSATIMMCQVSPLPSHSPVTKYRIHKTYKDGHSHGRSLVSGGVKYKLLARKDPGRCRRVKDTL